MLNPKELVSGEYIELTSMLRVREYTFYRGHVFEVGKVDDELERIQVRPLRFEMDGALRQWIHFEVVAKKFRHYVGDPIEEGE